MVLYQSERELAAPIDAVLLLGHPPSAAYAPAAAALQALTEGKFTAKQFRSQLIAADRAVLGFLDLYSAVKHLVRSYPHPITQKPVPCSLVMASPWSYDKLDLATGQPMCSSSTSNASDPRQRQVSKPASNSAGVPLSLRVRPFMWRFLTPCSSNSGSNAQQLAKIVPPWQLQLQLTRHRWSCYNSSATSSGSSSSADAATAADEHCHDLAAVFSNLPGLTGITSGSSEFVGRQHVALTVALFPSQAPAALDASQPGWPDAFVLRVALLLAEQVQAARHAKAAVQ